MTYRKGERTNRQRESEFAFAVDIPIPGEGLGKGMVLIEESLTACKSRVERWSFSVHPENARTQFFTRIGAESDDDADWLVVNLSPLAARRIR